MTSHFGYVELWITRSIFSIPLDFEITRLTCISLVHDCIGGKGHQRELSVLDGRTKLLVILLLCMTVMVESVIKERAKCTRWQDKIIGYISLVHDCIDGKCHQREREGY